MLEKIFLMKRDLFITKVKKQLREFMGLPQKKRLENLKKKVLTQV